MIQVKVQVRDEGVKRMLQQLAERTQNLQPVMAEIGEIVVESVQRNFEEHRSPSGIRWRTLSPRYARWKTRKKGRNLSDILILNRTLMGSIHHRASTDRVVVGTNVEYAAVHQFGSRDGKTPARPFLGVRKDDWMVIRKALLRHIMKGT